MTVDLLPTPRATKPAHRNAAVDAPHLHCVHVGPQDGWAQVEWDCPYCCGPETD
ncbi:hypothetical protein ACH9EU_13735 [Kocuria sp. M1R5S2]|uniref:hypothetical protein n=1 Tax=Kocuria rhizosphaerae TaxID=3376285 RepID=UPI00378FCD9D